MLYLRHEDVAEQLDGVGARVSFLVYRNSLGCVGAMSCLPAESVHSAPTKDFVSMEDALPKQPLQPPAVLPVKYTAKKSCLAKALPITVQPVQYPPRCKHMPVQPKATLPGKSAAQPSFNAKALAVPVRAKQVQLLPGKSAARPSFTAKAIAVPVQAKQEQEQLKAAQPSLQSLGVAQNMQSRKKIAVAKSTLKCILGRPVSRKKARAPQEH